MNEDNKPSNFLGWILLAVSVLTVGIVARGIGGLFSGLLSGAAKRNRGYTRTRPDGR